LDGAVAWAISQPAATKKFAVVGYCWGGGVSFAYATQRSDLSAAALFYGVAPPFSTLAAITAPVLAFYGGNDERVTSTAAPAAAELKRLGKSFDYEVYPGAGHAFLRQQGGMAGANLAAAQKSWPELIGFLKESLEH
jgi:carboxymethylenebutenolidase